MTTDASDYAIGAILSQGILSQDRPIAYVSIMSKANTTEKELLTIIRAVKHYQLYLCGTKLKIL